MAFPVPAPPPMGGSGAPPSDPRAIRACLPPALAAEFDGDWEAVLDGVKRTQDLADLHDLLAKWRHIAYLETYDPGGYQRLLAKAELIQRTGHHPDAMPVDELRAIIGRRLGR